MRPRTRPVRRVRTDPHVLLKDRAATARPWVGQVGDDELTVARTMRTRLIAIPGRLINRSGVPTLRLPTSWPWRDTFTRALAQLRASTSPPASGGVCVWWWCSGRLKRGESVGVMFRLLG